MEENQTTIDMEPRKAVTSDPITLPEELEPPKSDRETTKLLDDDTQNSKPVGSIKTINNIIM